MRTLHFDCFAGISGDMTLGALVDLGVDPEQLRTELNKLGLSGWQLVFRQEDRCGIGGTHAIVELLDQPYHEHEHEHGHGEGAHHHHEHTHEHEHADHHDELHHESHKKTEEHKHNSWREIRDLIAQSTITESAKKRALAIFSRIADAESQVHGVPVEDVAFHEVGALDSIIDIVGAAICIDILNPEYITASEIELGGGTVTCAHGVLPVPAPATLLLCQNLPVKTGGFQKEMTTPTGAAILAECVDEFVTKASFIEIKTGYGIGTRKMDKPNVLRVSWREVQNSVDNGKEQVLAESAVVIKTNIDDMTGEELGFLMEALFAAGALDVTFVSCMMKKNRPGTLVSVLCTPQKKASIEHTLFKQSSTIGLRESIVRKVMLNREAHTVASGFGNARVKTVFLDGSPLRFKIEYDDRARIAREQGVSLREAEALINEKRKNQ